MAAEPITERREGRHADIDLLPTRELVELINEQDAQVAPAVGAAAGPLAAAIDAVVERLRRGGRLIYAGAGSSGRLATVDAAECGPTFGLPDGQVVALIAGGVAAHAAAQEAAEDDGSAAAADLEGVGLGPDDAVVAISASGTTPYALGALRAAGAAGALTVAVTCVEGSDLADLAEHAIVTVVGPEVLAGSTRMKAGTAQKLVLNTISTVAMVRLGKTYGNLMVDVVASNAKLRGRARRAVELATDASVEEAEAALAAAGGDTKVAIVTLLTGLDAEAARDRLAAAGGSIRAVLEAS
jgi:N-acetylmuramic acid 6-phosphate etherase